MKGKLIGNEVLNAESHEILQVRAVQSSTPNEACEQADSPRDPGGPPQGEG